MLYQLKVKVESDTLLEQSTNIEIDPYRVILNCRENKVLNEIIIQKHIENFENILPYFNRVKPHLSDLKIPSNPHFKDMIEILKTIESVVVFSGIRKIYHNIPERSWIPENSEEEKKIKVRNVELNKYYDKRLVRINTDLLIKAVKNRKDYKHLIIPFAFFREGGNEFNSLKYVDAYAKYYYFLEDIYAEGKWRKKQAIEKFKKSKLFNYSLDNALAGLSERHKRNIKPFLKAENLNFNKDGIIELIVQVRGNIHHFSQKSPKKQGHPFNQEDFESMAYLLMRICVSSIVELLKSVK